MTTPLAHEPEPGDGLVPHMSRFVHRLYHRLPEVYRTFDARDSTWIFKRYLGGALSVAGEVDEIISSLIGNNPVGPDTPEPWALTGDELEQWREARRTTVSLLGDPANAPADWLPWLAQLLGATLDPSASEEEQRDTIIYATSGWRGGTRSAIADAAKTALTGTKYARIVPHYLPGMSGGITPGDIWDLTIVTRSSETPDPGEVLGAVLRKGAKPAGVILHHATYESTWDQQEAVFPTWADRDAATWDQLAEAGLVYRALTSNQFAANPSFEVNATGWTARGVISAIGRVAGGLDGVGMGRVTVSAGGTGEVFFPDATVTPGDYHVSFSLRPDQTRDAEFTVDWLDAVDVLISSSNVVIGSAAADEWVRAASTVTAPAGAAKAQVYVQVDGMLLGEHYDLDAALMRRISP
jgi:hypothetical protein